MATRCGGFSPFPLSPLNALVLATAIAILLGRTRQISSHIEITQGILLLAAAAHHAHRSLTLSLLELSLHLRVHWYLLATELSFRE